MMINALVVNWPYLQAGGDDSAAEQEGPKGKEEVGVSPEQHWGKPKEEQSVGLGDPRVDSQGSLPHVADRQSGLSSLMVARNPLLSLILYNNCVFIVHCMVWLQEIPLLLLILYNICGKYSSLQARFDFAPMDTVVEELVNSLKLTPARSTPVQVLLNESQVYDGTPDGTEEIIEGGDQEEWSLQMGFTGATSDTLVMWKEFTMGEKPTWSSMISRKQRRAAFEPRSQTWSLDFLLLLLPNNQITRFPTYIVAFIRSLYFPLFL